MVTDLFGREIKVGDYVVFTNALYEVREVGTISGYCKIMSYNPSKTTRPVKKYSKFLCIIPQADIVEWKLRTGN
jgi:hypothetical protein